MSKAKKDVRRINGWFIKDCIDSRTSASKEWNGSSGKLVVERVFGTEQQKQNWQTIMTK
jgi:hypothetical protein